MANYKIKGYRGIHNWIERRLGKPNYCVNCKSENEKRYEWANISGEYYKDLSDWKRMCATCHRKETSMNTPPKQFCKRGHLRIGNTYKSGACRTCKNELNKAWFKRKRLEQKCQQV